MPPQPIASSNLYHLVSGRPPYAAGLSLLAEGKTDIVLCDLTLP